MATPTVLPAALPRAGGMPDERPLWDQAQCKADPDSWFPEGNAPGDEQFAARICAGCEWRTLCDLYAHQLRPHYGIWAGVRWYDRKPRKIRLTEETADA